MKTINKFGGDFLQYLPLLLFFLLLAGCVFYNSTIFTDDKIFSKWLCLCVFCPLFLLVWYFTSHNQWSRKAHTLFKMYASYIPALVCIAQASLAVFKYYNTPVDVNFVEMGSFDNVAGFVSFICCSFPFVVNMYHCKDKKIKYLAIGGSIMVLYSIIISLSRAAYLGLIVVGAGLIYFKWKPKNKVFIGLFAVLCVIVGICCIYMAPNYKENSAYGRLLIWRVAMDMFLDKPFLGFGLGGVEKYYMLYQARYLTTVHNPNFDIIADNVNSLFNEYLTILINFGLFGFLLFFFLIVFCIKFVFKVDTTIQKNSSVALVVIGSMSMVTYTLSYPASWLMIAISVYYLFDKDKVCSKFMLSNKMSLCTMLFFILCGCFYYVTLIQRIKGQILWKRTYDMRLQDKGSGYLDTYDRLLNVLGNSPYFLYNYAYELAVDGNNRKSQDLALKCRNIWADYDLELLMGINDFELEKYDSALAHFSLASQMCPNRFVPLYRIFKVHQKLGQNKVARKYAQIIANKKVKVKSESVSYIKQEVCNYLNN